MLVDDIGAKTTLCGYGSRIAFATHLSGTTSGRHCERSEAIHRDAKQKAGLLRCARNDDINRHTPTATHTSAFSRRECVRGVREFSAFPMGRAWGMPGADAPAASHAK